MNDMVNENRMDSLLKETFSRLPEERLPEGFRDKLMERIILENERAKRKEERISLIATIVASLMMIAAAILTYIYMDIDWISLPTTAPSTWRFYIYIGGITMLLLYVDYRLRRIMSRSTESNKSDKMG